MSKEVEMFNFEGSDVRVIADEKGEPWFVAKDICDVLGLSNPTMALSNLDDEERAKFNLGRQGESNIINESGLYSLIMTSRKPEAKKFKKWVTSEVLPSIRKTGSYSAKPIDPMQLLGDPAAMRGLLLTYTEKVIALESKVQEQAPKVEAFEKLTKSDGSLNITCAAKNLGIPPKKLFQWMQANEWIYRRTGGKNYIAYQRRIQSSLLEHKVTTIQTDDGTDKITEQVRVTPKGLTTLAAIFLA